ncbi:hypothetical protein BT93_J2067 [Corymbia citriodora subsp. variegata]|nr:hypothetical protein BT93_J2067 [Corymbia citriodora subsp. variegata]
MEGGDAYRASRSLRTSSRGMWRNGGMDEVFSRSLARRGNDDEDDDEEALKWAALDRLPTFDRLRKGILTASRGGADEIDILSLGLQERKKLMERLLGEAEEDNESFLLKLKNRVDRVGIDLPTIEVRYEHLNVGTENHVGSRAVPNFINFSIDIVEGILNFLHVLPSRKKHLTILQDVSGIIKPGRMTLLLGPPSSGKTTLLLALAGRLDPKLMMTGKVTYNGHSFNEFVPQRTAAYISQHDLHLGEMTVRETLAFSARCQGVGTRYDMLAELSRREKAANIKPDPDIDVYMKAVAMPGQEANVVTDYVLKILGLEACADTMVGNQMIRGISGGQRKRVTTGEMLVGPVMAFFMDEISTGLDTSTTYQIVKSLKQFNHIFNGTTVISLLQPAPETYNLFDDVILLSDGQIVYQGPRDLILDFFESMGFKCPERKGVADFLQEVTSRKDQQQYWAYKDEPYTFVTVQEFAEAFHAFHFGRKLRDELSTPFDRSKNHPAALTTEKYGLGVKDLLRACASREYLLMRRNSFVYIFKTFQLTVQACITMTLFFRTHMPRDTTTDGEIYIGALFFTLVMIMFNGMVEISMTIAKLPVFYKQRDLLFYPAWAYALPIWISKIPITIVEVAVWVFLTYYVIGFDPHADRLFKQYLLLVLAQQMASALFRTMGAVGRNMILANTFGSFTLLLIFSLSGIVLSREEIKHWWIWGYWISPLMYGQNALAANELLSSNWDKVPFNSSSNKTLGVQSLESRGLFTHEYWYWIGVGAMFGFILLFNLMFPIALTFLDPFGRSQTVKSQDHLSNENGNREGGSIQLPYQGSSRQQVSVSSSRSSFTSPEMAAVTNRKRGMVLPFEQHSITFDEIKYSVDMPQAMKSQGVSEDKLVLLSGISGAFRPGVLTALMGVSGAGKTTLMDVLAGRKTGGYIEGNIMISGYPKKQETFARISGYCEQNDIHSPYVTVYESLVYSAWLRLPANIDSETRKMFVEEVMELVELNPLLQALVGLPGVNGLSTEQRKRLTIAVELVSNPSIIFMDEPTSGLDARAAAIVMRTVRNTVDTGRTVVCTIHQPSIDIFESFDELLSLKRGGQVIYAGPLGHHSCHLINYFEGIQGVSKIKDGYNPATWMLEVTSPAQELALGIDFAASYRSSDLYRRNKALIEELSVPPPNSKDLYFPTKYSQSNFTQFIACLWKQHWSYWRNTNYTAVRHLFTIFVALVFGSMYWDIGSDQNRRIDVLNAMGSMYATAIFLGVQNATPVQPVISMERIVFYRERAAGMYSALPYALAQVLIEVPYILAQVITYTLIVYPMIGFEWTAEKFFWFLFFMFFVILSYNYFAMGVVGMTPNLQIAGIISFAVFPQWNLFSGFLVPRTKMPVWWRWFYWACPTAWTLYGLVASQFGDVDDPLEDFSGSVKQYIKDYLGYRHNFLGVAAAVMVAFPIFFACIFAVSLKAFNFQRR